MAASRRERLTSGSSTAAAAEHRSMAGHVEVAYHGRRPRRPRRSGGPVDPRASRGADGATGVEAMSVRCRVLGSFALGLASLAGAAAAAEDGPGPVPEKTDLWVGNTGGYAHYRIPGIVVTARGSLLAYCEARKDIRGDWGTIDVLLRRSSDGGKTWDAPRKIVTPPKGVGKNPVALRQKLADPDEVTVNNPVAIVDRRGGAIHFLYCVEYARCYHMRSDDDGLTFSAPVDITPSFEAFRSEYDWKVLATG